MEEEFKERARERGFIVRNFNYNVEVPARQKQLVILRDKKLQYVSMKLNIISKQICLCFR